MKYKKKHRKVNIFFIFIVIINLGILYIQNYHPTNDIEEYHSDNLSIRYNFLTVNPYSRSGESLNKVKGVVIHYTANPGSTAKNNRNYFENLKDTHITKASSHFIIGLEGEIIQCIPLNEIAYASNNRNSDTISIECCHEDATGQFNEKTYQSLQSLVKSLMDTYHLKKDDIIRHYDVTGKICPKYFVDHEDAWNEFLNSL